MTREAILQINILIAEKVFGHTVFHKSWNNGKCNSYSIGEPDYYDSYGEMILSNPLPDYYENINDAWGIVDKLAKNKFSFEIGSILDKNSDFKYRANFFKKDSSYYVDYKDFDEASKAICLAALKTLGIEI